MAATSEQLGIRNEKDTKINAFCVLDGYIDIEGIGIQANEIIDRLKLQIDNILLSINNHFMKEKILYSILSKGFNLETEEKILLVKFMNNNILKYSDIVNTFSIGLNKRIDNEELDNDEIKLKESIDYFIAELGIYDANQLIDIDTLDYVNMKLASIYNSIVNENSNINIKEIIPNGFGHTLFQFKDGFYYSKGILDRTGDYKKVK